MFLLTDDILHVKWTSSQVNNHIGYFPLQWLKDKDYSNYSSRWNQHRKNIEPLVTVRQLIPSFYNVYNLFYLILCLSLITFLFLLLSFSHQFIPILLILIPILLILIPIPDHSAYYWLPRLNIKWWGYLQVSYSTNIYIILYLIHSWLKQINYYGLSLIKNASTDEQILDKVYI